MVVQHNLTAMNSNRMLGLPPASQEKSPEKLSSGYKINRAADDAAGLSISEKMRKQIRGLTQASTNAQDGISAVQTAEGALNEVQDMLQRMNELAVKSANGTNSETDRSYIQNEIDQLTTEIDRVSETTKFNETYLLKGDKSVTDYSFKYATTGAAAAKVELNAGATLYGSTDGTTYTKVDNTNISTYFDVEDDGTVKVKTGITFKDAATGGNTVTEVDAKAKTKGTPKTAAGTAQFYDKDGNKISANALEDYLETTDGTNITKKADKTFYDKDGGAVTFDQTKFVAEQKPAGALTLKLHVGADATDNNQISVDIDAMSAKGLGVENLKVDGADDTKAKDAIDTIKAAIQKVSTQRSALGAAQNRLEHTISNLDNVVENTTSAESQIRDTDMATEMVKYSNNNILAQAGQAMLAQANQSNQGVLSLLQ